jgi:hypothetical protein
MRRRDTALMYEMADVALKSLGSAAALVQQPVGGHIDSWTTCAMHLVADASHRAAPSHGVLAVRVDAPGSSAPLWHAVAPAKCDVRIDVLGSYVCAMDPHVHKVWLLRLPSPDVEVVDIERGKLATAVAPTVIGSLSQPPTTSASSAKLIDACLLPLPDDAAASFGVVAAFADGSVVVYAVELSAPKLHLRAVRLMRPGAVAYVARVGRVTLDGQVHVAVLDSVRRRILVCDDKGGVCRTFAPIKPATQSRPCAFAHRTDQPSLVSVVTRGGILLSYVDASTAVLPHMRSMFAAMAPQVLRVTAIHCVAGVTLLTVGSGMVYHLDRTRAGGFSRATAAAAPAPAPAQASAPAPAITVDLTCSAAAAAATAAAVDLTAQDDGSGGEKTETENDDDDHDDAMDGDSPSVLDRALYAVLMPQSAEHAV